jgi:hypothetical protein
VEELIDELSETAEAAIEQAAGEAAKAAAVRVLQEQAANISAAYNEAAKWKTEYRDLKKAGRKQAVIAGAVSFGLGLLAGTSTAFLLAR